jgi:hypothetical protein
MTNDVYEVIKTLKYSTRAALFVSFQLSEDRI